MEPSSVALSPLLTAALHLDYQTVLVGWADREIF